VHPGLSPRHGAPCYHHERQHAAEAVAFRDELDGEFGQEEGEQLQRVTVVEVVGGQPQVIEQVVGQRVGQVAAVELQAKEHDAEPRHEQQVRLADDSLFFLSAPRGLGVPTVLALVLVVRGHDIAELVAAHHGRLAGVVAVVFSIVAAGAGLDGRRLGLDVV